MALSLEMLTQIQPMGDRVLLRPVESEKVTASGIIIPDSANKERPSLYEVIAVGSGGTDKHGNPITIDLQAGDRVISGQYSGDDVKV